MKNYSCSSLVTVLSWFQSVKHARERNCFAYVLDAAHPCCATLYAHAEACVRYASVTAQIQIPVESLFGQFVYGNLLAQEIQRGRAFASAYNFAVAFRRKHVNAKRKLSALWVARHVESFNHRRIMMNHNGLVEMA